MWPVEKEVRAGVRQSRSSESVRYQGYLEVIGQYGRFKVPVGPWRTKRGLALRDAKGAEIRHKQMQREDQEVI